MKEKPVHKVTIDEAKRIFDRLYPDWVANKDQIETEQDARFQVIDQILCDVLGWERAAIKTEPHVDSGFVDYLVMSDGRARMVVEAKRIDKLLVDTKNPRYAKYKVSGPALQSAASGLDQAKKYCLDTAVPFASLTTGFEWIGFWALRTDGKPPAEGKAVVFPDLEAVSKNFAEFYDLFSKEGVLANLYQVRIHEAEGLQVRHVEDLQAVIDSNEIRLLRKTSLAADLERIFRQFFSTMSGDNDASMLADCFVESKESGEADVSLEKITRNLINRVDVVGSSGGDDLESHIRSAVATERGEFVLIIGNKGAGKSTFIDRFFRLVLERSLREHCLVVRVDLADSDGDPMKVASWLTERAKNEIEKALFKGGAPSYEELQGIFYSEYQRWMRGEHKFLYERDKGEFKERFGEYIYNVVSNQPNVYVARLLQNAVASRKLMPCLVFDNTDHFSQSYQEQVFQYAQSLHRSVFSFVICPITDRTIWQLSKSGPLQSYDTSSFYLPVPPTKEILKKRVSYLKKRLEEESKKDKADYVLTKGMRLTIQDVGAFAAAVEEIFVNTDFISRMVGWLSNHDIRRSLKICQRIITSPIVSIEELIKAYLTQSPHSIPRLRVAQALLFGDYNQFNQGANEYILNVFSVEPDYLTSPLLKLSILRVLLDRESGAPNVDSAYVTVEDLQNYLEPCGIDRIVAQYSIRDLLAYRLVEPYDPTDEEMCESLRIRITHSGKIHYEFAQRDFIYIQGMALTTPLRGHRVSEEIRSILHGSGKMDRGDWDRIRKAFMDYVLEEDAIWMSIPNADMYASQTSMRTELNRRWARGRAAAS